MGPKSKPIDRTNQCPSEGQVVVLFTGVGNCEIGKPQNTSKTKVASIWQQQRYFIFLCKCGPVDAVDAALLLKLILVKLYVLLLIFVTQSFGFISCNKVAIKINQYKYVSFLSCTFIKVFTCPCNMVLSEEIVKHAILCRRLASSILKL